jgi:3-oxoacyl-[acyl-carrier-protein] synthase III
MASDDISDDNTVRSSQRGRYQHAAILGLGSVDGPEIITSRQIEEQLLPAARRLSLPLDLLTEMTGIRERRVWPKDVVPSAIATAAGRAALNDAGVGAADIDLVINASVCQDFVEPAGAAVVAGNLGVGRGTLNFDVRNACLGFMTALDVAATFIDAGRVRRALIVVGETSRGILDKTVARLLHDSATLDTYRAEFVSLTLGSCGVGVVVGHADLARTRRHRLVRSFWVAGPEHHALCVGTMEQMRVDAKALTLAGLILGSEGLRSAFEHFGLDASHYSAWAMHQTSKTHLERFCELIDVDSARFTRIYETLGNVGAAGVGRALIQTEREGRVREGENVALLGVGSGLNAALMEVAW